MKMDPTEILRGVERKRPQAVMLGTSLIFLFLSALLMAGLSEILLVLTLCTFGMVAVLIPIRIWGSRRMLRPVAAVLTADAGAEVDRKAVRRALVVADGFPFRETVWLASLWMMGMVVIELVVYGLVGTTFWQQVTIAALGLVGSAIEGMLTYDADVRQFAEVRRLLEVRLRPQTAPKRHGWNLDGRLLASFGTLAVLVLLVCGITWYGRARQDAVADELAGIRTAFNAAATGVQDRLSRGAAPGQALAGVDPEGSLAGAWVLFDRDGEILAGSTSADPVWLKWIVSAGAQDWLGKRAPFVYLRSQFDQRISLFWIMPAAEIGALPARAAVYGLLAGLLMLVMGLIMVRAVARSGLRPIGDLAERVTRLAAGELDQSLSGGGGGEMALLGQSLDEFVGAVAEVVSAGRRASTGLREHHQRLSDGLEHLRLGGDQRADIAERTASSVMQMQTSLESISEQVDSLRQASTDCSSTLFEIEQSVREVSTSAENLQSLTEDSASAINQITRSMGAVAENVETLSKRAEETDASISAMGLAMQQVEDNTSETHRLTDTVSEIASKGAESVRETIDGIHEIQAVTGEAREVINRLGQQMEAVGKILTVISDVAQQTNLLALNAAIIAAAAGEHGKGFAVVADEIKDLADRTATSTKEIAGLIKSVQADSRRAVDAIERGSGSVQNGVQLANNAGNALQQILNAVSDVGRMSSEIHRSTREHSDLATTISKSMGEMSTMLREIRRAMNEQTQGGDRINRVAEQLREDARFVGRSAGEQVQAVSGVSQTMERISEMVGFVSKAITEQAQGVGHVAKAAEEVRDASMHETAKLADVEEIAERIGRVTGELSGIGEAFGGASAAEERQE